MRNEGFPPCTCPRAACNADPVEVLCGKPSFLLGRYGLDVEERRGHLLIWPVLCAAGQIGQWSEAEKRAEGERCPRVAAEVPARKFSLFWEGYGLEVGKGGEDAW